MKQKQLVKRGGEYVEEYIDQGPGRAVLNHGRPTRSLADRGEKAGRKQVPLLRHSR